MTHVAAHEIFACLYVHPEWAADAIEVLTERHFKGAKDDAEAPAYLAAWQVVSGALVAERSVHVADMMKALAANEKATRAVLEETTAVSRHVTRDCWIDWLNAYRETQDRSAIRRSGAAALSREDVDIEAVGERIRELAVTRLGGSASRKARASFLAKLHASWRDPNAPAYRFVSTGFPAIDGALRGGWPVGLLTLIAGGTSVGKTLVTETLARNALWSTSAFQLGRGGDRGDRILSEGDTHILIVATEEPARTYLDRMLGDLLDVAPRELDRPTKRAELFDDNARMIERAYAAVEQRLTIYDTDELRHFGVPREIGTIEKAVARWAADVRREAEQNGQPSPQLLVLVDYMQKVCMPADMRFASEQAAGKQVSTRLIEMAKRVDVALVCAAMLNGRIGQSTADTASVREGEDGVLDAAVVIYLDTLGKANVHALRKQRAKGDPLTEIAVRTMRLRFMKGRHSGCADDMYLRVDYERQRITTFSEHDEYTIEDHMQGNPVAWGRRQLEPARKTKAPVESKEVLALSIDGESVPI